MVICFSIFTTSTFAKEPQYNYEFDLGKSKGKANIEVKTNLDGKERLDNVELLFTHNNNTKKIDLEALIRPSSFGLWLIDANGDGYKDFFYPLLVGAGPFPMYILYVYSETHKTFIKDETFPEEFASIKSSDTKGCLLLEYRGGSGPMYEYMTSKWCFDNEWQMHDEWPSNDNK